MICDLPRRIGALLALVALCSGCIATSDLEQLNRDLSRKMDSTNTAIRDDLVSMGEKVDQMQASQQALRGDLTTAMDGLRAETRKGLQTLAGDERSREQLLKELEGQIAKTRQALKDYVTTSSQALEQIARITTDVNRKLATIEKTVAAVQGLPPAVSALGTELRALRQTLQQTYALEEAALRHRLQALEELRHQLETNPKQANKGE